jgi:DNA-directed RNA polymerase specialized sigma24 family protein
MTREAFDLLLRKLDRDAERAAEMYEHIRSSLIKFFESRGCLTPEDETDETIDRVARRVSEGVDIQTDNSFLYFYGVALRVLQEYQRRRQRERTTVLPPAPPEAAELEQRLECMERCLSKLPAESRELVVRYAQMSKRTRVEDRLKLAERMNISLNTLRIRVHRIREGLETCVKRCLQRMEE